MTHLLAAGIALACGVLLVFRSGRSWSHRLALAVFVFGTVNMLTMSGVFHLLSPGGTPRHVLLLLDHAGIWFMIAGTCTPLYLLETRRARRLVFLGLVWSLTIAGVVLKSVFFDAVPEWLSLSLYLGLGWFIAWSLWPLMRQHPRTARLFVIGGVAYSVGAVLDLLRVPVLVSGVVGPHELFHVAILIGVGCHWTMIAGLARFLAAQHASTPPVLTDGPLAPFHAVQSANDPLHPNPLAGHQGQPVPLENMESDRQQQTSA